MGIPFFLYGIYDEGQSCFSRFQNFIENSQLAYVKGRLCQLACGLPLFSSDGNHLISGKLVELSISENHWPIIDALNGYNALNPKKSLLRRETVHVIVPESPGTTAHIYALNEEKKVQAAVELSPEECLNLSARSPSLLDQLTERQKTYLSKLSRAKGREIIPVDMALYRELLALELIIDKGRRLALTKLGQEISHFI